MIFDYRTVESPAFRRNRSACLSADSALWRVSTSRSRLKPHPIASADGPASEHGRVNAGISLIVLGRRPENAPVLRQIALGQCRHDAALTGTAVYEIEDSSFTKALSSIA